MNLSIPRSGMRLSRGSPAAAVLLAALIPASGWAQSILTSSKGGPPTIVGSDLAVLEVKDPRDDLPCSVLPQKPLLGFDLKFHAGYEIRIPMKELAGDENQLTILFRVIPESATESPVYLQHRIRVPKIEEDAKGDAFLQGSFDIGVGRYKVDWLMRDRMERVCSSYWDVEAELPSRDSGLEMAIGPHRIDASELELFTAEPPVMRAGTDNPVNVKVLVNFAPQNSLSAALRPVDTAALVSILRQFQREPRIHRFSIVAFNLQQRRILYRQESAENIDLPAIGRALEDLKLGSVDFAALQEKHSETLFLTELIKSELAQETPPDALIFAGPKAMLDKNVSQEELRTAGEINYPIFYMNYNLNPQTNPWRDSISHAVRFLKGLEFTISRPRDLWNAVTDIVSRVVQSKSERKNVATSGGLRSGI